MSNVREITCASPGGATLRGVLLNRPDAHPLWWNYIVSLIHLRPLEGSPPPNLAHPDASHEIMILALHPDHEPDPGDSSTLHYLQPPNLAHQLRGRTDEYARALFDAFVQALAKGELSPDTDYRRHQTAWLERWGRAS